jgi:hypothetical protein
MRSILICGLLIVVVIGSGCSTPGSDMKRNEGIHIVTEESNGEVMNLSGVIRYIGSEDMGWEPLSKNDVIQYISAYNVSSAGIAERWIIGVKNVSVCSFYIVSGRMVTKQAWDCKGIYYTPIVVQAVISPEALIQEHNLLLSDTTGKKEVLMNELTLENGVYTTVLQNGTTRKYVVFDAKSGEEK